MDDVTFAQAFIKELEMETTSTAKCLERITEAHFDFKPHPTSLNMGYVALLVTEIPLWIPYMINEPEIDFETFPHFQAKSGADMLNRFNENVAKAKEALSNVKNGDLDAIFSLKSNGETVFSASKRVNLESTINHMVHHRGQLTVYLRMNEIPVPSIYGPSADYKGFDKHG